MAATGRRGAELTVVVVCSAADEWQAIVATARVAASRTPPCDVVLVVDHDDELHSRLRALVRDDAAMAAVRVMRSSGPRGRRGALNTVLAVTSTPLLAVLDIDDRPATHGARTGPVLRTEDLVLAGGFPRDGSDGAVGASAAGQRPARGHGLAARALAAGLATRLAHLAPARLSRQVTTPGDRGSARPDAAEGASGTAPGTT